MLCDVMRDPRSRLHYIRDPMRIVLPMLVASRVIEEVDEDVVEMIALWIPQGLPVPEVVNKELITFRHRSWFWECTWDDGGRHDRAGWGGIYAHYTDRSGWSVECTNDDGTNVSMINVIMPGSLIAMVRSV